MTQIDMTPDHLTMSWLYVALIFSVPVVADIPKRSGIDARIQVDNGIFYGARSVPGVYLELKNNSSDTLADLTFPRPDTLWNVPADLFEVEEDGQALPHVKRPRDVAAVDTTLRSNETMTVYVPLQTIVAFPGIPPRGSFRVRLNPKFKTKVTIDGTWHHFRIEPEAPLVQPKKLEEAFSLPSWRSLIRENPSFHQTDVLRDLMLDASQAPLIRARSLKALISLNDDAKGAPDVLTDFLAKADSPLALAIVTEAAALEAEGLPTLMTALEHPDLGVRHQVAWELHKLGVRHFLIGPDEIASLRSRRRKEIDSTLSVHLRVVAEWYEEALLKSQKNRDGKPIGRGVN